MWEMFSDGFVRLLMLGLSFARTLPLRRAIPLHTARWSYGAMPPRGRWSIASPGYAITAAGIGRSARWSFSCVWRGPNCFV